jgi:hypothetical protein
VDSTIIVTIIGATGAVLVAVIGYLAKRNRPQKTEPQADPRQVSIGNVTAQGDAVVAGRDVVLGKEPDRFISRDGCKLVTEVSRSVISDEQLRFRWSSFDAQFLDKCLRDSLRGWIFDGAAFQEFRKQENDSMFSFGVSVYTECCKRIGDEQHKDYKAFNRIADLYWNARKVLNPERAAAVEWWHQAGKDKGLCDDCSTELKMGEGYLVPGSVFEFDDGRRLVDNTPSLVCESCFERRKEAERGE